MTPSNQTAAVGGPFEPLAFLRDLDGTGSLHACAANDPGAIPVIGFNADARVAEALDAWAFNVMLECAGREEGSIDVVIGGAVLNLRDLLGSGELQRRLVDRDGDWTVGELLESLAQSAPASDGRLPPISHARDCAYVVNDGPAPCTCDFYQREGEAIEALAAPASSVGEGAPEHGELASLVWREIACLHVSDGDECLILNDRGMFVAQWDAAWGDDGWWMVSDGKDFERPLRGDAPSFWMPCPKKPAALQKLSASPGGEG